MSVRPAVEPAVIAGKVMLAVLGAQTGAGLVITKVGKGLTVMFLVADTAGQPAGTLVVNVKTTGPE